MSTSKTAAAKAKTAAQPENVHIAWHNRPATLGIGLLLVLACLAWGFGGPMIGTAQDFQSGTEAEMVAEPAIDADNSSIVVVGGEGEVKIILTDPRQSD